MIFKQCGAGRRYKQALKSWSILAAGLGAAGFLGCVSATEIDLGNPDFAVRWDNTVRYTLGERAQAPSYKIMQGSNFGDGDRNFQHGIVTDRLDLLSEADLVYKQMMGVRVSGAFWYDNAYAEMTPAGNVTPGNYANGVPVNGLSDYAKRVFEGPSGELLDAFAFVRHEIGDIDFNLKVGRHSEIWGESLFLGGAINGISYAQSPIDIAKAYGNPGAEAKELFRPIDNVSLDAQVTNNLSVSGQYYLEWAPFRYPEDGTYYGMYDLALHGGQVAYLNGVQGLLPAGTAGSSNLWALRGSDVNPKQQGSWGVSTRWSPELLDGTIGLYYRDFTDMNPQLAADFNAGYYGQALNGVLGKINPALAKLYSPAKLSPSLAKGDVGDYFLTYQQNIKLYGVSLAKEIAGVSVGAEFNFREGMPLVSDPVNLVLTQTLGIPAPYQAPIGKALIGAPLPAFTPALLQKLFAKQGTDTTTLYPTQGHDVGAVGNTMHAVVNFLGTLPGNAIWDGASWASEFTWSHLAAVTANEQFFAGRSYNLAYGDSFNTTRNAMTGAISFTPTWYSVMPSVDLSAPMSFNVGLFGNSPVALGGNKNAGSYVAGVNALVDQVYSATLEYTGVMGRMRWSPTSGLAYEGLGSLLQDRGTVYLILKTTF